MSGSGLEIPPGNSAPDQKATEQDPLWDGPSGVIALAGMIIAALAMWLFFRKGLYGGTDGLNPPPPNLLAVNLSFCAMIMGVFSIFRVRRISGQGLVRAAAIVAVAVGMVGPFVFFWQGMHWRGRIEQREVQQLSKLAMAARQYAEAHNGVFPTGVRPLLLAEPDKPWHLAPHDLLSPFRQGGTVPIKNPSDLASLSEHDAERQILEHSDFVYLGAGLPGKAKDEWQKDARRLIVATSKRQEFDTQKRVHFFAFDKRIGEYVPVGFGSGEAKWCDAQKILEEVIAESDKAREDRGLSPLNVNAEMLPQAATLITPGTSP